MLARLIESGRFGRHLRRMREAYAAKRDVLVDTLVRVASGVELGGLAAGFHAVAHLPEGLGEVDVDAAAQVRDVGLYGMSATRSSESVDPPQILLGFGNLSERAIGDGIERVGDLLQG